MVAGRRSCEGAGLLCLLRSRTRGICPTGYPARRRPLRWPAPRIHPDVRRSAKRPIAARCHSGIRPERLRRGRQPCEMGPEFARKEINSMSAERCTHLDQIKIETTDKHACEECIKMGDT